MIQVPIPVGDSHSSNPVFKIIWHHCLCLYDVVNGRREMPFTFNGLIWEAHVYTYLYRLKVLWFGDRDDW